MCVRVCKDETVSIAFVNALLEGITTCVGEKLLSGKRTVHSRGAKKPLSGQSHSQNCEIKYNTEYSLDRNIPIKFDTFSTFAVLLFSSLTTLCASLNSLKFNFNSLQLQTRNTAQKQFLVTTR